MVTFDSYGFEFELYPFTSLSGPLELALISGFCSVKRMRVVDSPGQDTNSSQVSPQQKLILILPTSGGWKAESTLEERSHQFSVLGRQDLNLGPCGWKAEILPMRKPRHNYDIR